MLFCFVVAAILVLQWSLSILTVLAAWTVGTCVWKPHPLVHLLTLEKQPEVNVVAYARAY